MTLLEQLTPEFEKALNECKDSSMLDFIKRDLSKIDSPLDLGLNTISNIAIFVYDSSFSALSYEEVISWFTTFKTK